MSLNRYNKRRGRKGMKQRSWFIFAIGFFVLFTAMSEFVDQKGSVKRAQNNPSIMTEEEREEIAAKGYEFGNWARTDGIQLQDNVVTEIAPNVLAKNYYIKCIMVYESRNFFKL